MFTESDRLLRRVERAEAMNQRLLNPRSLDTLVNANARAERAEATLRAIEVERAEREQQQREAVREANERSEIAARNEALQKEIEATRVASWTRYLTEGDRLTKLAANNFSPHWIKDNTPQDPGEWPPDDCVSNHHYINKRATEALEESGEVKPCALVLEARKRGLPV